MKTLAFMLLVSGISTANDLIYRHGFEHTVSISGQTSGLNAAGLVLVVNSGGYTEFLNINNNGQFSFFLAAEPGNPYLVSIQSLPNLPNQQSCALIGASGVVPNTGVNTLQVNCDSTVWHWDVMSWDQGGWQ